MSVVPPTGGAATTFATGFSDPYGLAVHAGSLYVANITSGTLSQVTENLAVPFKLGGTAESGVAYSSVTASPLTFGIGQTTQSITGTLLSDPGPNQTLTFTLGTLRAGRPERSPGQHADHHRAASRWCSSAPAARR